MFFVYIKSYSILRFTWHTSCSWIQDKETIMNDRQIEKLAMLLIGVAIGISMSGGLIPKGWESIAWIFFLVIGTWLWLFSPKFLKKLTMFG